MNFALRLSVNARITKENKDKQNRLYNFYGVQIEHGLRKTKTKSNSLIIIKIHKGNEDGHFDYLGHLSVKRSLSLSKVYMTSKTHYFV